MMGSLISPPEPGPFFPTAKNILLNCLGATPFNSYWDHCTMLIFYFPRGFRKIKFNEFHPTSAA